MRRHGVLVLALVAAAALVAVASPASASAPSKAVEACAAVTADDIQSALGVTGVGPNTQGPPITASQCGYQWTNGQGGVATANVVVGKLDKSVKRDIPKNAKAPGAEKIPGVKKGYVNVQGGSAGAIGQAIKGKTFVTIQLFTDGVTKAQLLSLMKTALSRV